MNFSLKDSSEKNQKQAPQWEKTVTRYISNNVPSIQKNKNTSSVKISNTQE